MEKKIERDGYISIPILFLIGALFHFVFEWFGSLSLIAPFFPVNESIWEHTKLSFIPLVLFYITYYFIYKDVRLIRKDSWFTSLLISVVVSTLTMIIFYYSYSGIFGKDYTLINILTLLISLFIGQWFGLESYLKNRSISLLYSISFLVVLFIFYLIMTFYPFHIPLFYDFASNKYSY